MDVFICFVLFFRIPRRGNLWILPTFLLFSSDFARGNQTLVARPLPVPGWGPGWGSPQAPTLVLPLLAPSPPERLRKLRMTASSASNDFKHNHFRGLRVLSFLNRPLHKNKQVSFSRPFWWLLARKFSFGSNLNSSTCTSSENGDQIWCLSCVGSWLSVTLPAICSQIYRVCSARDKAPMCGSLTFQILGMTHPSMGDP